MITFFDFEVYKNFTLLVIRTNGRFKTFIKHNNVWLKGECSELKKLRTHFLVGYNSDKYDLHMLELLMKDCSNEMIKAKSDAIINEKQRVFRPPNYKSIDLKRIIFNKDETAKSLKLIACDLKHPKLQELPIEPNATIDDSQVTILVEYCKNDVLITEKLYNALIEKINIRLNLFEQGYDVLSSSDSGIANRLSEKWYEEITGLHLEDFKNLRTVRKEVFFKDAMIYGLTPQTVEMQRFFEALSHIWFEIDDRPSRKQNEDKNLYFGIHNKKFQKNFKKRWLCFKYHTVVLQIGIGGIHSVDEPGTFYTDSESQIIDFDIDSLYPRTNVNHRIHPAHLDSRIVDKLESKMMERLALKKLPDSVSQLLQKTFKLVINAFIGKYCSTFNFLQDNLANLQVTLSGQLSLLILIERLALANIEILSVNTDGITCRVKNEKVAEYNEIIAQFCKDLRYTGEFAYYAKYLRRDVNNYLAITTSGKVKPKGCFVTQSETITGDLAFTKGFAYPVIALAVRAHLIDGENVETFIKNHKDIYDFTKSEKSGKKFSNELRILHEDYTEVIPLQRSVRFYVSNKNEQLVKCKIENRKKKYTKFNSKYNTSLFMDYHENVDINYEYYVKEAMKLIASLGKQQEVFEEKSLWEAEYTN